MTALQQPAQHRHWNYRGCAPVPADIADFPGQSLGNDQLTVGAWSSTDPQQQKQAAAACATCPVLDVCRSNALTGIGTGEGSVVVGGLLPEQLQQQIAERRQENRAWHALTEHRNYAYRGCAPDPDQPTQAQGNLKLNTDAWGPYTEEGGEERSARNARLDAAVAVCAACPVLEQCRTYGLSENAEGKLTEPEGVLGGMRSLERHNLFIKQRATAQTALAADHSRLDEARTAQKQALIKSLARETDEELVAYRAGMDVRTSNWHRAILTGLLGLDKETASRQQLLERARELGVLPAAVRIVPDGKWPIAAAPNTDGSRQRRIAPARPVQLLLPGFPHLPRGRRTPATPHTAPARRPRLRIVRTVQPLTLPIPTTTVLEPAA